uniref:PMP-22/EMP/MP20/Claudin tight junction n=2 Tax=Mesocestoides corti TaxID=53468 RepID=A0A5K3FT51_MESCO
MSDKEKLTRMYMPFYAACGFTAGGFIFFLFSFSSPYWIESYDYVHSSFLHLGLWSACFNKFIHPQDFHANELTGCYWMYDRFFFQIGIWEWLNPYWLVAIQTLIIVAFIANLISVLVLVLYYLLYGQPAAESTIVCGLQIFTGVLLSISLIVFGVNSQDRRWMQRPDQNFLSWSYGFLILATICSFIAAAFLCCVSYTDRAAQREVEHFEAVEGQYGARSVAGGTYLTGRHPSTLFARSLYGTQSRIGGGGGVVVNVPATDDGPPQQVEIGGPGVYTGGPMSSQLSPLREEQVVDDDDGIFSDQGNDTYVSSGNTSARQSSGRGRYHSDNDTPTQSLLYGYRRAQR